MTDYASTTNACKLCNPLGACLAFRGIEGAVPFLHGSQGCATYMRRYIISHFGEPIDIASSALGEKHAVFGGGPNLKQGIINVIKRYQPSLVGVATTCLTETIGDDVPMILEEFRREFLSSSNAPILVHSSTPSYSGTHCQGFRLAVRAVVSTLTRSVTPVDDGVVHGESRVNLLPGFVSPQDIRYLRELTGDFGISPVILPDISDTLDAPILTEYPRIPKGGTPLGQIRSMGWAKASIEFGSHLKDDLSTAHLLEKRCGVRGFRIPTPIGIRLSDRFIHLLQELSGRPVPANHKGERDRLVDAMVDCHKYVFGKRVVIYGEEELVISLASFISEIGAVPVLCATGGTGCGLADEIMALTKDILKEQPKVMEGVDFWQIEELCRDLEPDLIIGHSKGYKMAKNLSVPLIRVGFPIHDRIGGQRILHIGYRGAQQLFDRIVNTLIASKQEGSGVGYWYF